MTLTDTFRTPIGDFATGCMPKASDSRDHMLDRVPAVAEALSQPLPQRVDHGSLIWEVTNQGSEPSCVAFSTAYCLQAFEMAEAKQRISFDGHGAYLENGGDGRSGIPADRVLRKTRADGFPVSKSGLRFKIDSYQWTNDLQVVLAAITANRLCVIACLLPSNFWLISKGDNNFDSGTVSSSYHQLAITGFAFDTMAFDSDGWVFGPNSWGRSFGADGFYRLRMSYLKDREKQKGYFYGYSLTDAPDGDSVPLPTPTPVPVPIPKPVGKIGGIYREQRSVVPIQQIGKGGEFIVLGGGFGEFGGNVFWGLELVKVLSWAPTRITCLAPMGLFSTPKSGRISVRPTQGAVIQGPSLVVL